LKIVVLDGYTLNPGDLSWEQLHQLGELIVYDRTPIHLIVERAQGAHIILTNKTPIHEITLLQLPELRYIGVLATGYDVIDVAAASQRQIMVSNVPAYGTEAVAQFTIALMLELCHRIGLHSDSTREGEWSSSPDWCYWNGPLIQLSGKTLGLIGMGRIGGKIGTIAQALGMRVIGSSRTEREMNIPGFRWVPLDELFTDSDVISLHCPLTQQTEGIINKYTIDLMKRTAFLINTARGKLIVEQDLANALNEGRLAGAGLDVLSTEPPKADNPLLSARNCIVTPHIAWAATEARRRLLEIAVENTKAYIMGNPQNIVNP
jgi:glycerate dehydrogenase